MAARSASPLPRPTLNAAMGAVNRLDPDQVSRMIDHLSNVARTPRLGATDRARAIDALEHLGAIALPALSRIADDGERWSTVREMALVAILRILEGAPMPIRWNP